MVSGFDALSEPIAWGEPTALFRVLGLSGPMAYLSLLVVGIPILLLCLLFWFLTQRNLLNTGSSGGTWAASPVRRRLTALFELRAVLGLLVPVGVVVATLLFQLIALVTSRRLRTADAAPATPPPTQHPAYGPPTPYAQTAPAARPVHTPPVPAFPPARPATYVPTQAQSATGAAQQIAYQELHPGEQRTIAGYQLLGRIGSGGMGTVYLARREGAATQVALRRRSGRSGRGRLGLGVLRGVRGARHQPVPGAQYGRGPRPPPLRRSRHSTPPSRPPSGGR
ncbi:hypothetical protein ACIQ9Q_33995 [Streptomyces sp. NPDC094438]|uniref:hypothetical protein n=1 Tax=Streptomyces sp. NPDC094438 TaxID=3366061 RepID=UPI00380D8DE4